MNNKLLTLTISVMLLLIWSSPTIAATKVQMMEKAGFTTAQIEKIEQLTKVARKDGLPEGLVAGKLREGLVKRVSPVKIIGAIKQVTSRYHYAYEMSKQITKDKRKQIELGNIIAAGIASGMTKSHAETLVLQFKNFKGEVSVRYNVAKESMLMARDLSRRGIGSETVKNAVEQTMQRGLNADDIHSLRGQFDQHGSQESVESFAQGHSEGIGMDTQGGASGGKGSGTGMDIGGDSSDMGGFGGGSGGLGF